MSDFRFHGPGECCGPATDNSAAHITAALMKAVKEDSQMHDAKGRSVQVGDTILVPFKVKETYATEEYCNVQLETIATMHPGQLKTTGTFNTKQILRANEGDDTSYVVSLNADGTTSIA